MQFFFLFKLLIIIFFFLPFNVKAKETWIIDESLSIIKFELPILFANNVKGQFNKIKGLIEIDIDEKKNNKAIISVSINSIELNYEKYKKLILSNIFFNSDKYPIGLIDTKKFSYKRENKLILNVELNIKGTSKIIPLELEIIHLADELVQIKGKLNFSRTDFKIGTGTWSSTAILKDKVLIKANLFLFKK